jgi:hypothetical protein
VSNVQIPNLPAAGALTGTEQLELVQAGVSVRATIAQIVTDAQVPTGSDTLPGMDGGASAGVEVTYSRGDHIHPTDTTRYAASNPANYVTAAALGPYALIDSQAFTGTPSMPTGTIGVTQAAVDSSTKLATTAFVKAQGYQVASALGTMSTQNANSVAITGGAINGTTVGATTPSTGAFTNLSASGTVSGAGFTALLAPYALTANVPVASSTNPSMDGTVAIGVGTTWARADHVHPSDTSRYAASNPAGYQTAAQVTASLGPYALINSQVFTGTPSLPTGTIGVTQAPGDSSTKLATTAFVGAATTALGLGTMAAQNANSVAITGGAINNTAIGATTRSSGAFTTLAANGAATFTGSLTASPASANVVMSPTGTGTVTINPATLGSIDNMTVGATTPSTGKFTTLSATSINSTPIGPTTPSTGAFTTLSANGAATFTGSLTASPASANVTFSPTGTGTVTINPATLGHVDNTAVGATTPSTGAFTNLSATGTVSGAGFTTLLNPYALVNSQVFTGTPSLPTGTIGVTQATATNNTTLATTAFVKAQAYLTANQTITHTGDATGSGTTSIPMTVVQLQGRPLAATAPATGNLMGWNGSTWGPVAAGAAAAGGTNGQIQYNNGGVLGGLTLNGTGNPVGTTSPTLAGTVTINGGALGAVAGNSIIVFSPNATDTNGEALRTEIQRASAGSDWTTAKWQIYRQVDGTKMGYFELGNGSSKPIAFGNGVTEFANFDNNKNLTLFGNVAATEVSYTNGVNPAVVLSKSASGGTSRIIGSTVGSPRWQMMFGDATAEGGSNAGSNFGLQRYTDAGVFIDTPFQVVRSTGWAYFTQVLNAQAGIIVNYPNPAIYLGKTASGQGNSIYGQTAGANRWQEQLGDTAAESTGNAGSNYSVSSYTDAGAYLGTPFTILRAGGYAYHNGNGATAISSTFETAPYGHMAIRLNKAGSGKTAVITGHNNGLSRWAVEFGNTTAESGSNAGSDFDIQRSSDTGAYLDTPFAISRATGQTSLTASPIVAPASNDATLFLNKPTAAYAAAIVGQKGGLSRWNVTLGTAEAEGGSNAGSNFYINRYNDAGVYLTSPLSISRANGGVSVNDGSLTINGTAGQWPGLNINKIASGLSNVISASTNGVGRWQIALGNQTAESANSGSDFSIARFNDAGTFVDTPFVIGRGTGMSFVTTIRAGNGLQASGGDAGGFQLRVANNAYGAGFYNDGANNCYLMSTNTNDAYGVWSGNRPFYWNMSSGAVTIAGNGAYTTINGGCTITGQLNVNSNFYATGVCQGSGIFSSNGQMTNMSGGAENYINVCDAAQNGGQYRNLTIRGLDGGGTSEVTMGSVTMRCTTIINNAGACDILGGFYGRQGPFGAQGGINTTFWNGANVEWRIGGTFVGYVQFISDYRVKQNVAALPSMWDRIKALKPISYELQDYTPPEGTRNAEGGRDDPEQLIVADGKERWGFVAHELQEILTEDAATGVKDAPDMLQAPNPWTVIAALTKALQEAMTRIEALEARA